MLRLFITAFQFMYQLREEFKQKSTRFGYRWVNHPMNGQIDVQPVNVWFHRQLPMNAIGRRRLYLAVALEPISGSKQEPIVISYALDLDAEQLSCLAYKLTSQGRIDLLADTAQVKSERLAPQLALNTFSQLQKALQR